jgi:biopolymer transport protein ExbD
MRFYVRQRRMPTVIIVSLIDIFAILLIFVIVTTTFRREQPEVVIKLPESKTAAASENVHDPVVLSISEKEEIFLDQKPVSVQALAAAIKGIITETPDRPLALNADKKAPFCLIIHVLDILKEAGVRTNVSAFTETAQ